jgi:two-component system sensor histidine kinase BaeS
MRSLRLRLFAGILGAALVAVVVSLAIGVVLTRGAVRDQIADEVASQADLLAFQVRGVDDELLDGVDAGAAIGAGPALEAGGKPPGGNVVGRAPKGDKLVHRLRVAPFFRGLAREVPGEPPPAGGPGPAPDGPPGLGNGAGPRPQLLTLRSARAALPASAYADLRADGAADGRAEIDGERQIYSARRVGSAVVLASRPDSLTTDDFSSYFGGLLLAGAIAAVLAGLAAALLARRLAAPIARVGDAARSLAEGRDPGRLPPEKTAELAALSDSFNDMSDQLARSREAERAVLLSVSHELRTPLTAIRGYAEGLEDGTVDPQTAASVVGREADRLGRLVGDLLALVKLEQGVLDIRSERVNLAEAAHEAERRLRPQATASGVAVTVEANGGEAGTDGGKANEGEAGGADGAGTPSATGGVVRDSPDSGSLAATADADRVVQVVSNLVENAIRVTPAGGSVTVSVTPGAITVSDTGPGIPAEDLEHAFDRFHLRRRHGRGSPDGAGLGLAIVRELTEAMGGSVAVQSSPGASATFTIRLPPAP